MRFWHWLGRLADGISIWQVLGPLGLVGAMSWAAAEFQAIADHGWGAVVIAGVGIACFALLMLTGSLALYRVFRPLPPVALTAVTPSPAPAPTAPPPAAEDHAGIPKRDPVQLTADQIQCRVSLKQFALTWPANVYDGVTRTRQVLLRKIKQNGDRDYSHALHHAMHFAWSGGSKALQRTKELASVELAQMDIEALQHQLQVFFDEYVWEQRLIANLNVLVKVDLHPLPETQKWLAIDKDCWAELGKQSIWKEASKLKKITEDKMASNAANWTTPFRVNF